MADQDASQNSGGNANINEVRSQDTILTRKLEERNHPDINPHNQLDNAQIARVEQAAAAALAAANRAEQLKEELKEIAGHITRACAGLNEIVGLFSQSVDIAADAAKTSAGAASVALVEAASLARVVAKRKQDGKRVAVGGFGWVRRNGLHDTRCR
jgi:hypothetical protein